MPAKAQGREAAHQGHYLRLPLTRHHRLPVRLPVFLLGLLVLTLRAAVLARTLLAPALALPVGRCLLLLQRIIPNMCLSPRQRASSGLNKSKQVPQSLLLHLSII